MRNLISRIPFFCIVILSAQLTFSQERFVDPGNRISFEPPVGTLPQVGPGKIIEYIGLSSGLETNALFRVSTVNLTADGAEGMIVKLQTDQGLAELANLYLDSLKESTTDLKVIGISRRFVSGRIAIQVIASFKEKGTPVTSNTIMIPVREHKSMYLLVVMAPAKGFDEWSSKATRSIESFRILDGKKKEYAFRLINPASSASTDFEDDLLRISFVLNRNQFGFTLFNKTDEPIRFDWDKLAYVDANGESHRVIHAGIRYIERDRPQAPTIVPPNAKVSDLIFPVDYIRWQSGISRVGDWKVEGILPRAELATEYRGKRLSIFMPLEINGKFKNYNFVFEIDVVDETKIK